MGPPGPQKTQAPAQNPRRGPLTGPGRDYLFGSSRPVSRIGPHAAHCLDGPPETFGGKKWGSVQGMRGVVPRMGAGWREQAKYSPWVRMAAGPPRGKPALPRPVTNTNCDTIIVEVWRMIVASKAFRDIAFKIQAEYIFLLQAKSTIGQENSNRGSQNMLTQLATIKRKSATLEQLEKAQNIPKTNFSMIFKQIRDCHQCTKPMPSGIRCSHEQEIFITTSKLKFHLPLSYNDVPEWAQPSQKHTIQSLSKPTIFPISSSPLARMPYHNPFPIIQKSLSPLLPPHPAHVLPIPVSSHSISNFNTCSQSNHHIPIQAPTIVHGKYPSTIVGASVDLEQVVPLLVQALADLTASTCTRLGHGGPTGDDTTK
ncbi:hypothetical protein HOY82DRAFT_541264 [Tuber indicum]|nr:hypothetical protein HOY82DRAFT_541264 [Tuber indicum]